MASTAGVTDFARLSEAAWRAAPIESGWILAGDPVARCAELSRSTDGLARTMAWDCSAGRFRWHNYVDETVHIIQGEVHVADSFGRGQDLRPGDVMLFRAGTTFTWSITDYVMKVAFLRSAMPSVLGPVLRAVGRLGNGPSRHPAPNRAA